MSLRAFVKGALTFVPGMQAILPKPNAGSNPPPEYFYGVWLKHITLLAKNGLDDLPQCVAELGPGDSLGLGLAALLSGVDCYYGLDIFAHTDRATNQRVLDQLVKMFHSRAPRPTRGWPDFDHLLDPRHFPSHILTDERLARSLSAERLQSIRRALESPDERDGGITLSYRVPWDDPRVIAENSVDVIISHAVLEHVADVRKTYRTLYRWLKPGGVMSHQIDFRSHNLTPEWNGYRAISEPVWRIMVGRRPYLINRVPYSGHLNTITDCGFEIIDAIRHSRTDGIPRSQLSKHWRDISEEDLTCDDLFVQARKPAAGSRAAL